MRRIYGGGSPDEVSDRAGCIYVTFPFALTLKHIDFAFTYIVTTLTQELRGSRDQTKLQKLSAGESPQPARTRVKELTLGH